MAGKQLRVGDFVLKRQLGAGQFGVVYLGEDVRTKEKRAIKVLKHSYNAMGDEKKSKALTYLETEIKAMRVLDSDHIVKLYEAFYTKSKFYLVMEYCDGGDLQKKIQEGLPRNEALSLFRQLSQALHSMHSRKIMHRDLKPANLLLHQGSLKLGDFGLAKEFSDLTRPVSYVGTLKYMAPEVMAIRASSGSYTEQADLWSAGVILYEMLTGEKLFTAKDETSLRVEQEQKARTRCYFTSVKQASEECRDLLSRLLVFDPSHRISPEEFYTHPFVTGQILNTPLLDFSGLMCFEETKSQVIIPVLALDIAEELCQYASESLHPFVFYLKACQVLGPHIAADVYVAEAFNKTFAKMEDSKTASSWETQHCSTLLLSKAIDLYKEAERYGQLLPERRTCYRRVLHLISLVGRCQAVEDFREAVLRETSRYSQR